MTKDAVQIVRNALDRCPAGEVRTISWERLDVADEEREGLLRRLSSTLGEYATFRGNASHLTMLRRGLASTTTLAGQESFLPNIVVRPNAHVGRLVQNMRKRRGLSLSQASAKYNATAGTAGASAHVTEQRRHLRAATLATFADAFDYDLVLVPRS